MARSSCMSLLALAFAVLCYITGRDISANMFVVAIFIIQGLKSHPSEPAHHWDRIFKLCTILSVGILIFSAVSVYTGMHWARPRPW